MKTDCCTGNDPRIRSAAAADLERVRELVRASGLPDDDIDAQFGSAYAVAAKEDRLIGVAGLETYEHYGLLRSVAVDPEYRGLGIARALIHDRLERARLDGKIGVFLLTESPQFFEALGFQAVARDSVPSPVWRSSEFREVCPDSATAMVWTFSVSDDEWRRRVRDAYAGAAKRFLEQPSGGCCGGPSAYSDGEARSVSVDAANASLGSGEPLAHAGLKSGETVLDLGSGGGIDVLIAASKVGANGKVYGLDMTDEMLELARKHQREAGIENVEFVKGVIESVPLEDATTDVVVSNCVINLSPDKSLVLREAFRVLRPGGRFSVSDIVADRNVPETMRSDVHLWTGCVSGALAEDEYRRLLEEAGFEKIEIVREGRFKAKDSSCGCGDDSAGTSGHDETEPQFFSARVTAWKPVTR